MSATPPARSAADLAMDIEEGRSEQARYREGSRNWRAAQATLDELAVAFHAAAAAEARRCPVSAPRTYRCEGCGERVAAADQADHMDTRHASYQDIPARDLRPAHVLITSRRRPAYVLGTVAAVEIVPATEIDPEGGVLVRFVDGSGLDYDLSETVRVGVSITPTE
jgi:hypothetical protein